MKTTPVLTLSIAFAIGLVAGCKKQDNSSETQLPQGPVGFSSIEELFASLAEPPQIFTINANTGGALTGNQGTRVTFPADCFEFADGSPVTGNVMVTLREVFSTSQMIFTNVLPVMNIEALNSGGEIFLAASQNGTEVFMKDEVMMDISVPAQTIDENMELFIDGSPDDDDVSWIPADSAVSASNNTWSGPQGFSFNSLTFSYDFSIDSMTWVNCDAFFLKSFFNTNHFNLLGADSLDQSNTAAYAVYDDYNSIRRIGLYFSGSITDNVVSESYMGPLAMHIVVISLVDDQLYTGILPVIPENGVTYDILMSPSSAEELEAALDGLP